MISILLHGILRFWNHRGQSGFKETSQIVTYWSSLTPILRCPSWLIPTNRHFVCLSELVASRDVFAPGAVVLKFSMQKSDDLFSKEQLIGPTFFYEIPLLSAESPSSCSEGGALHNQRIGIDTPGSGSLFYRPNPTRLAMSQWHLRKPAELFWCHDKIETPAYCKKKIIITAVEENWVTVSGNDQTRGPIWPVYRLWSVELDSGYHVC